MYTFRIIFTALLLLLFNSTYGAQQSLDRIAAIVNDDIITVRQVHNEMNLLRMQAQQAHTSLPSQNVLYEKGLDNLIDKKLQLQMAKAVGLEISDAALTEAINDIAKRNNMTVEMLKNNLASQGINFTAYQQEIREQIIMNQIQQHQIVPNISVSEGEVKQIQNKIKSASAKGNGTQYHVIDILIPLPENPSAEATQAAEAKVQNLMTQIHNGADFSRLAIAESTESHIPNGGDFGWQPLDKLPELFAQKVQTLSAGQIAGPIRAANGLHIIKLDGVSGGGIPLHHRSKQSHIRHILIKTDKMTNDEIAKIRLLRLKEQLQRGADFSEVAKINSQDNLSNAKGGDLGWVSEGLLDPNFESTMNRLKINQIGGPVKTAFGWHLMQVLGRREVEDTKEIISNQARNIAYQQKVQQSLPAWLQQLRSTAYIKKYPNH